MVSNAPQTQVWISLTIKSELLFHYQLSLKLTETKPKIGEKWGQISMIWFRKTYRGHEGSFAKISKKYSGENGVRNGSLFSVYVLTFCGDRPHTSCVKFVEFLKQGSFINHVTTFFDIFDHLPLSRSIILSKWGLCNKMVDLINTLICQRGLWKPHTDFQEHTDAFVSDNTTIKITVQTSPQNIGNCCTTDNF